jgi:serine/threonine-protein kinase
MIGTTIAQYRITAALGAGGMGEVWRAADEKLGREVALKVLPEEIAEDPGRMARFEREAKVLASLNHPNIAHLYGLETSPVIPSEARGRVEGSPEEREKLNIQHFPASGGPSTPESLRDASAQDDSGAVTFLIMELVEGEDLSERISRGGIPVEEAVPIAMQIAEALENRASSTAISSPPTSSLPRTERSRSSTSASPRHGSPERMVPVSTSRRPSLRTPPPPG